MRPSHKNLSHHSLGHSLGHSHHDEDNNELPPLASPDGRFTWRYSEWGQVSATNTCM